MSFAPPFRPRRLHSSSKCQEKPDVWTQYREVAMKVKKGGGGEWHTSVWGLVCEQRWRDEVRQGYAPGHNKGQPQSN